VLTPGEETEPPSIGRGREHGPAVRCIFIIDMAHSGLAAIEHALGLREPLVTRVELIGHGQRIVGRQLCVARRGTCDAPGVILSGGPDGREVIEPMDSGGGVPNENGARPEQECDPGRGKMPSRFFWGCDLPKAAAFKVAGKLFLAFGRPCSISPGNFFPRIYAVVSEEGQIGRAT
jgi:hypothetical protein